MNLVESAGLSEQAVAPADLRSGSWQRSEPVLAVHAGPGDPARPRQWRVRCQDVANRERFLTVFAEHGRVVLVGPPGEAASLSPGQLSQLRSALQEAADEAER